MAATSEKYYIKTDSFQTATSLYLDANLTTKASDGFYSLGGIWRQQVGGVLSAISTCVPIGSTQDYIWGLSGIDQNAYVNLYYRDKDNKEVFVGDIAAEIEQPFYFTAIKDSFEYTQGYVYEDDGYNMP
jgi:hypothetical protein